MKEPAKKEKSAKPAVKVQDIKPKANPTGGRGTQTNKLSSNNKLSTRL